jgi:hypothetical protein
VGRSFIAGNDFHGGPLQVVGVVKDAHTMTLDRVEPMFYQPIQTGRPLKLLLRSTVAGAGLAAMLGRFALGCRPDRQLLAGAARVTSRSGRGAAPRVARSPQAPVSTYPSTDPPPTATRA